MRSTTTFSILFWTYTQRAKNNKSNVYARITINGNQVNISLHEKVNVKLWDSRLQKAKGNSAESRMFNFYLDEVRADLVQCYRDLRQDNRVLTPQLIKARYLGEDKKIHSLKDIFDYHTETMDTKLCAKTLCHYRTSQKYILAYVLKKFKSQDRYLNDLNYAFVLGFESFLRSYQPKHYQGKIGNNTVMKHIQRLRKMVTLAYDIEWIERDPFIKFKPKLEKKEREFLTDSELQKIERFQTSIERLEVVRDLYIFSCYTGISYCDMMELYPHHIVIGIDGDIWIMANRNKTNMPFKIPLLQNAAALIDKYKYHPRTLNSGKLLPSMSNQRLNSYLKEIADLCGITKNLTFHMARHTFATTITLSNGVPIETVSKLLGHTTLKTTQIYARVVERKLSEDIKALRNRIET